MNRMFFSIGILLLLASCSENTYLGDQEGGQDKTDAIMFGSSLPATTRADIYGSAAATLLGNNFYVTGTKGTEAATSPSPTLVFDNYLVHYGINTAGTTESNTANWEYVGIDQGATIKVPADYERVKLSSIVGAQTIKFWDYSAEQYDFLAFSTGSKKAVSKTTFTGDGALESGEIGVTAMRYGSDLASPATAYTFYIPELTGLQNAYITDITPVAKADYGKEVQLQFKNLGSKIRIALYETVPGYSIDASSVKFYTVDNNALKDGDEGYTAPTTTAALISADATNGFAEAGTIAVSFPNIGTDANSNGNKNKASVYVTPQAAASPTLYQEFGTLASGTYTTAEGYEAAGSSYLGRSLPQATYAGESAVGYYQVVFPVSTSSALTLRVDYQLISTDGSGETIKVYGAKAVVPATYTVWQPNYAYTYVFKISDNTNGWTNTTNTDPKGLFPITFDAVVQEIKDVSGEQTTITTVATPSITTYQQGHDNTTDNEYDNDGNDIYVQVMDNSTSPATLKGNLNDTDPYVKSKLYSVETTGAAISEATVMDALQNRTTEITSTDDATLTGRNGITLTKKTNIDNTVTSIVNGVDDQAITVTAGQAAKITISSLTAGTYAYVYDYGDANKTETTIYQPMTVTETYVPDGTKYITTTEIEAGTETSIESVAANTLYFSKNTTNGTDYTYSYYSVDGKATVPAGLKKVAESSLLTGDGSSTTVASAAFVFDVYIRNTGSYAVKLIKIVDDTTTSDDGDGGGDTGGNTGGNTEGGNTEGGNNEGGNTDGGGEG